MSDTDLIPWMRRHREKIGEATDACIPMDTPARLSAGIRQALCGDADKLRGLLVLAASDTIGVDVAGSMRAAVAVELAHALSLAQQELPCLDGGGFDVAGAGVCARYGETVALLAGDAALALAFEVLTADGSVPPPTQARWCALLARGVGHAGLVGGMAMQALLPQASLREVHLRRTSALFHACIRMGMVRGSVSVAFPEALRQFAETLALAWHLGGAPRDAAPKPEGGGIGAGRAGATADAGGGADQAATYLCGLGHRARACLERAGLSPASRLGDIASWMVTRATRVSPEPAIQAAPRRRALDLLRVVA